MVAETDPVRLGDAVGFGSSQSFAWALASLPQELERKRHMPLGE
jgi:hypothetical protein